MFYGLKFKYISIFKEMSRKTCFRHPGLATGLTIVLVCIFVNEHHFRVCQRYVLGIFRQPVRLPCSTGIVVGSMAEIVFQKGLFECQSRGTVGNTKRRAGALFISQVETCMLDT